MGKGWLTFVVPPEMQGNGTWELGPKDKPRLVFGSKKEAMDNAAELAKKHPGQQVFVCESVEVLETAEPRIVHKRFNEQGELLPLEK